MEPIVPDAMGTKLADRILRRLPDGKRCRTHFSSVGGASDGNAAAIARIHSMRRSISACLMTCTLSLAGGAASADSFAFFRYDDDFTSLRDPEKRISWYDDLKYVPIPQFTNSYLSFGADLRERVESYDYGYFGLAQAPHTTYELHRALVDADVHLDELRIFLQLGNYIESGRQPAALPTDDDRGDVQQAFIDYAPNLGTGRLTLRSGRFETKFGEGLIVSPRDGPNIRQAWDGVQAFYELPEIRIDLLAVRPVTDKPGYLDDASNAKQSLWGVYVTLNALASLHYGADLYYFGNINHAVSLYTGSRAPGEERTATFGGRWYGSVGGFDSTNEIAIQTGHFNARNVLAFAVHNEAGWTFSNTDWTPRLGIKADVLSGSRKPLVGTVGTFNALYPNVSYGSDAVLEAPANLIEAGLDVHLHPTNALDVEYTGGGLWRYSTEDAFYASPLFPLIAGSLGNQRYTGLEQQVAANCRINRFLTLRASVVHFSVGGFVREARGRDTNFAMFYIAARL